ncbi:MAG: translocation/assembly module TamB domain-containing protein, partial [Polyangiaceae bacterium]
VQPLGELQGVRTGLVGADGRFIPVALDASSEVQGSAPPSRPVRIAISLGNDVTVKRGTTLDVRLEGAPVVTVADTVRVSGQIRLVRGSIDVQGKPFEIEKGTITFVGDDPSNPQVVLTAGWTASDGTRVYAEFNGPLKTGKVTLRSDPPVPGGENAILALILFGSSDQGAGTGVAGASPAAGLAGGAATAPINQALGGVNEALDRLGIVGSLSTKIDTSQANPRPEVEVQIARDISLQVAWVIGLPPPDMPDSALATFDWRFLRKWSLETTVGDKGTSILDVVWNHRY